MALQEYCKKIIGGEEGLEKTLQAMIDADENDKNYTRQKAEEVFSKFFGDFTIT